MSPYRTPIIETVSRTEYVQDPRIRPPQTWEGIPPSHVINRPPASPSSSVSRIRRGYTPDDNRLGRHNKYCNWTCCLWALLFILILIGLGFALSKAYGSMFGGANPLTTDR